jgi:hypothetical protein
MTSLRAISSFALLLAAVACSGRDDRADTTAARDTTAAGRARSAAAVANAIAAKPAAADSVLRAAGYTPEEFEQLMYDIAADSAMSAVYAAAKAP